jgi:hypothetical protein
LLPESGRKQKTHFPSWASAAIASSTAFSNALRTYPRIVCQRKRELTPNLWLPACIMPQIAHFKLSIAEHHIEIAS